MIKERALVARYGEAFVKYARQGITTDEAINSLKKLRKMLQDNQNLRTFLEGPEVSMADKYKVIDKVFQDEFPAEVAHFVKLLIAHKRFGRLADIVEYVRLKYSHFGEQEVLLKTSYPLELDLIKRIQEKLEKKLNKKCKFYIELDSRILGGIQVIIGNRVIDGSVRGRLNDLKEKLQAIRVN